MLLRDSRELFQHSGMLVMLRSVVEGEVWAVGRAVVTAAVWTMLLAVVDTVEGAVIGAVEWAMLLIVVEAVVFAVEGVVVWAMLLGVVETEVMAVMLTAKGSTFTSIILMLFLISLHNAHGQFIRL